MVKHESEQALDALNAKLTETLVSAEQAVGGAVRTVEAASPSEVEELRSLALDLASFALPRLTYERLDASDRKLFDDLAERASLALAGQRLAKQSLARAAKAEGEIARGAVRTVEASADAPTRHPAEQALLDACDAVRLRVWADGTVTFSAAHPLSSGGLLALAEAINHWRAAKAEGEIAKLYGVDTREEAQVVHAAVTAEARETVLSGWSQDEGFVPAELARRRGLK